MLNIHDFYRKVELSVVPIILCVLTYSQEEFTAPVEETPKTVHQTHLTWLEYSFCAAAPINQEGMHSPAFTETCLAACIGLSPLILEPLYVLGRLNQCVLIGRLHAFLIGLPQVPHHFIEWILPITI